MDTSQFQKELAKRVRLLSSNTAEFTIQTVSSVENPQKNSICFSKQLPENTKLPHECLLLTESAPTIEVNFLVVENARLAFALATQIIAQNSVTAFSHEHLVTPNTADENSISRLACIYQGSKIGKNTIIEPFATIYPGVEIGDNCYIKSGARIGGQGFGFERDETNIPQRIIHTGGLKIGNGVEIGCNSVICAGTVEAASIDNHVKIDDNVLIAHNCHVGQRTMIAGCADISGSVTIGSDVWIGPRCVISNKITIGDNATVIIGSVVARNITAHENYANIRKSKP